MPLPFAASAYTASTFSVPSTLFRRPLSFPAAKKGQRRGTAETQWATAQALRQAAFRLAALTVEAKLARLMILVKAGFRPSQLHVAAGSPHGGRWTGGAIPINRRGPRSSASRRVMGRWQSVTPETQEARLAVSFGEMQAASRTIRRIDRGWKPTPQLHEAVEGEIAANNAVARGARFRAFELTNPTIGPGPYSREWIAAPPTNRKFRKTEQEEIDRIGRQLGCHRCGEIDPKTPSGNFIGDHQMPKSQGTPTRIYPNCLLCGNAQGGMISQQSRQ